MVLYIGHRATSAAVQDENGEAMTSFETSFEISFEIFFTASCLI
jgi:hypothetical protein|tara:strand:- start:408 stop:539 length:132 start_codon:yes stop_codon:yes gene_type:complete